MSPSSPGKGLGAAFEVRIPRGASVVTAAAAAAALTPSAPQLASRDEAADSMAAMFDGHVDLSGLSVLVVDDHPDFLEIERRHLEECGAKVSTASSAEQALVCLRTDHHDVPLSDLGLPAMDGYGLIHRIRSTLGLAPRHLPAAAATAFARPEDQQRALRAGYQTCIVKPASQAVLVRLVHDLARSASTERDRLATAMPAGAPAAVAHVGRGNIV